MASILERLIASSALSFSNCVSAYTLDRLRASYAAILDASISASTLDLLMAVSAAIVASLLDLSNSIAASTLDLLSLSVIVSFSINSLLRAPSSYISCSILNHMCVTSGRPFFCE